MARRRYRLNFPWLSCWLKERKTEVEHIMCLEISLFLEAFWILASMVIFMHQRLFPRNLLMAENSGISKLFRHDPYVLGLFIPQGCRPMTTYCILSSFQVAYQDRRCGRVSLDVWNRIIKEGAPQVYRKSGVLSRGSTLNILADRRGNHIHIRSVSQLKKDAHDRPRERSRSSTVLPCWRWPSEKTNRLISWNLL